MVPVKKNMRWLRRAVCLALTLALVVPLMGPATVVPASAVTQQEINALKEEAEDLDARQEELQEQLETVQSDKEDALSQKQLLEQQIGVIQREIDNIDEQIAMYDQLIAEKTEELAQAERAEAEQYELFCTRVRYMEEQGETSYWSVLFSSSDFSELLDNYMMVQEIMDYDNQVMDELIAIREQVAQDKAELEEAQAAQEAARQEQQAAKEKLEAQEAQVDRLISQISAQEDELEAMEADLKRAAAAMDAEISRKERELQAQMAASGNTIVSESGFIWPSYATTITSLFGNRTHPITGRPNNHTGVDIAASGGSDIWAAKSGVVLTSTYNNSYGNYVVVSHANGESTLYAHMSRRLVSEGETVTQGQTIGLVGTTGSSTGNHLHFEIRVNGVRQDPMNYFVGSTFTLRASGKSMSWTVTAN